MPGDNFKEKGRWTELFNFPNVVVHASLLPSGKVLCWGRRKDASTLCDDTNMNEHETKSYLWTPPLASAQPVKGEQFGFIKSIADADQPSYKPTSDKTETVNVFCSGHCLLPGGNLLVVGGHLEDAKGVDQASIFNQDTKIEKWEIQPKMNRGRWYPSAITLPDGRVLCVSGSNQSGNFDPNNQNVPQVFSETGNPKWIEAADAVKNTGGKLMLDLYPKLHIDPRNGQVFMAGPKEKSWFFRLKKEDNGEDIKDSGVVGTWVEAGTERKKFRDYGPSVMYDSGKIMYIGGESDPVLDKDGKPKTFKDQQGNVIGETTAGNMTEIIDLKGTAKWEVVPTAELKPGRRHFNATVLPDGTVFVNGGSSDGAFNNFRTPVLEGLLMDPSVEPKTWMKMNPESLPRCYHGVSLLLPDGRVLSAGSGEAGGIPASDCHQRGQLFEPPYLFKGTRPSIAVAPTAIDYEKEFKVDLATNDSIKKVSWVRLGSVTHTTNMGQSYMTLSIVKQEDKKPGSRLSVQAPLNANVSPPGHYMLFVLNAAGVPSTASIIQIPKPVQKAVSARIASGTQHMEVAALTQPTIMEHDEKLMAEQDRPHVVIGLTPLCPYGLGACWGGAYDGLQAVTDIDVVRPAANTTDSLAFVYLKQDTLPDIDVWRREFARVVNTSYKMRGIEVTVSGKIIKEKSGADEQLTLAGTSTRVPLVLAPFQSTSQLKWDIKASAPKPVTDGEVGAYRKLAAALKGHAGEVKVTGTLQKHGGSKYSLDIREFEVVND